MAGTADDVLDRLASLSSRRTDFEWAWRQVAKVAAPDAGDFTTSGANGMGATLLPMANATRRSKDIYDSTAVWAVDRLASGIEALIIPQSEYWHGFDITDLSKVNASDAEKQWMENLRNLFFRVRYDSDSGWIAATQTCLRRLVAFGNAFMLVEDSLDSKALIRYRPLPLAQCYADENHQGVIDTFYWTFDLSARQAVQKYGAERVSKNIKTAAESPRDKDRQFRFVQAIFPRADYGHSYEGVKRSPWATVHIEQENKVIVRESGYYEFPVIDFRWLPEPGQVYGEGPVMKCLADIQSVNVMAKNELTASDQAVKPPLLVANAGVVNQPTVNPNTVVVGGISPEGKQLVQPMNLGQRLDFHTLVLEAKRNQVKESLYINLFALLVQNPQMSATEALIRANEKGELLGPAGSRVQQSLSNCVDREEGILRRRGLYDRGSEYEVPRSLQNRSIGPQMSGPLNKLRRTKEAEGVVRVLQVMSPLAQVEPEVVDNFDGDNMARELTEIFGAPRSILRDRETVQKRRKQRAQQQAQAQNAMIAEQMAKAGKLGGEALAQYQGM